MRTAVDAGIVEAWLAATGDGAIAVDAAGMVVLHNPAASRVTGLAPTAAMGRPWREVLRLDSGAADLLWTARVSGSRVETRADVLCAQGNLRTAEISGVPWQDSTGEVGLLVLVRDLAALCRQRTGPAGRDGYGSLVGVHPAMQALYDLIEVVAPSDAPVLVEGEPGAGKELVAQLLHARSRRAERPLVAVSCAALSADGLESELFGRVRGTTGGAVIGRIELAHTGTLFLDEVAACGDGVQAKLLRTLRSGELERAGDVVPRHVDVRIIAGSSQPLEHEVRAGRVRPELYHHLRVIRLVIPPLRERLSDVPLLVEHFLAKYGRAGCTLTPEAVTLLQSYRWPRNVRELENVVRQAAAAISPGSAAVGATIGPELLPYSIRGRTEGLEPAPATPAVPDQEDRRALLLRALSSHGGNRTAAARSLGIGRATFYRWWRAAGLTSAPDLGRGNGSD